MSYLKSKWVSVFSRPGHPKARLFCFPYAGGNAQVFKPWVDQLPSFIQVCGIQPPGRSSRFTEPAFTSMEPLLASLLGEIKPFLDMPFIFYGHSLGSAVSFDLTRILQEQGQNAEFLFVSGRTAPHLPRKRDPIYHLPDDEFKAELHKMNGTPQEILENEELMELMVPMLRADFSIADTYQHQPGPLIACPLVALGGVEDPDVDEDGIRGWGEHAGGAFNYHMLPGDHFFINQSQDQVLHLLSDYIVKRMAHRV